MPEWPVSEPPGPRVQKLADWIVPAPANSFRVSVLQHQRADHHRACAQPTARTRRLPIAYGNTVTLIVRSTSHVYVAALYLNVLSTWIGT